MSSDNQMNIMDLIPKPKEVKDKTLPKGIKLKTKESWCPYCSMPVIFLKDKRFGIHRCPNCNISDKDFWVKQVNKK